jgi:hypothetical protein
MINAVEVPYPVLVAPRGQGLSPRQPTDASPANETALHQARLHHLAGLGLDFSARSVLGIDCTDWTASLARKGCQVVSLQTDSAQPGESGHLPDRNPHVDLRSLGSGDDLRHRFGRFDIVVSFACGWHLADPTVFVRNLAACCGEWLFLESLVCDHSAPVLLWSDEACDDLDALKGVGCIPSPGFVTLALNRAGFPFVYAPAAPASHPDFRIRWENSLQAHSDGHVLRCAFIASRRRLPNPRLALLFPDATGFRDARRANTAQRPDRFQVAEVLDPFAAALAYDKATLNLNDQGEIVFRTTRQPWSYAVSVPLKPAQAGTVSGRLRVTLQVRQGMVAVGAESADGTHIVGEKTVAARPVIDQDLTILVPDLSRVRALLFRNGPFEGEGHGVVKSMVLEREIPGNQTQGRP